MAWVFIFQPYPSFTACEFQFLLVFFTEQTALNLCFPLAFHLKHGSFVPMFPDYLSFFLPHILIFFFSSYVICFFSAHLLEQFFRWQWSWQKSLPWRWRCLCWLSVPRCPCRRWSCPVCSDRNIFQRKNQLERERDKREQRTNIVSWVRLGLTQYLFVCHSHVTHWFFTINSPCESVKISVSLRYGTNPIKRHEKSSPAFQSCSPFRLKQHRKACGVGQVMVSVYLLAVNTSNSLYPNSFS